MPPTWPTFAETTSSPLEMQQTALRQLLRAGPPEAPPAEQATRRTEDRIQQQAFLTGEVANNPEAFAELVEHHIALGQIELARWLWQSSPFSFRVLTPEQRTERIEGSFHVRIARAFMDMAELELAMDVLNDLPAARSNRSDTKDLWNRVQYRLEARRLGLALFPEDGSFSRRWTPEFGAEPEVRARARVRYLGRVETSRDADEVRLILAEASETSEGEYRPEIFRSSMETRAFLEAANRARLEPEMDGQFLEAVEVDGTLRIFLRPRRSGV